METSWSQIANACVWKSVRINHQVRRVWTRLHYSAPKCPWLSFTAIVGAQEIFANSRYVFYSDSCKNTSSKMQVLSSYSDDDPLKFMMGPEQMAPWFRETLLSHREDVGSISCTHIVVHTIQNSSSRESNDVFCGHQAFIRYTYTHVVKTLIHIE